MILPVDPNLFLTFLGIMAVLAMTPGPAVLYAIAQGVERGRRAVLAGVAGINTAMIVWFTAAALGLSAVFAAHPGVFRWLTLAGAAYVAWLGASAIRHAMQPAPVVSSHPGRGGPSRSDGGVGAGGNPTNGVEAASPTPPRLRRGPPRPEGEETGASASRAFAGGFAVQIANPKVLLFFTAVLPPFIDAQRPVGPQLLLFALGTLTLDVAFMTAYGLSGAALTRLMAEPRFRRAFGLFVGVLLLSVAVLIALRLR